ncbi:MAG: crossover junction endodeoxyribonuclease RuvC [Planctomycetota bacterium]|nr:crossover junction endodeoxyribonuclease RuvC [Planctomycetota bacterium]
MARILGIDPGLQITGYGLVDLSEGAIEPTLVEGGCFRFSPRLSLEKRLGLLHDDLSAFIEENRPTHLAVEQIYAHYAHPRTAILMAHARGVVLLCAQRRGMAIEHMPATAVKKAMTGFGHATKQQMQLAVQGQCRLAEPPSPPDVADAIAIALTFGRRLAFEKM